MRTSLVCWHWTFCWLTLDILWQTNGHKLNVRLFEEITQGHVKAKEDLRLRIDFVSRASLVAPLASLCRKSTDAVAKSGESCGLSTEPNGKKIVYIRPSANTLFDGMDTGALPLLAPQVLSLLLRLRQRSPATAFGPQTATASSQKRRW